jgi:glutamine cyclotransferase
LYYGSIIFDTPVFAEKVISWFRYPLFLITKIIISGMNRNRRLTAALFILVICVVAFITYQQFNQKLPLAAEYTYQVINKYPHDPKAFTEGLVLYNGVFYEGTGLYGESCVRTVDPETGAVLNQVDLPPEYFGEGVTILNDVVYQLTWKEHVGFTYDLNLHKIGEFSISGEGWGLSNDGRRLIMSDGTSTLSFIDPDTMNVESTVTVTYNGEEVTWINELEYIEGVVYANIWRTDKIALIDLESGNVVSWLGITGLKSQLDNENGINVLNGIAYDQATGKLYVTGKLWPNLFEIRLVPK